MQLYFLFDRLYGKVFVLFQNEAVAKQRTIEEDTGSVQDLTYTDQFNSNNNNNGSDDEAVATRPMFERTQRNGTDLKFILIV